MGGVAVAMGGVAVAMGGVAVAMGGVANETVYFIVLLYDKINPSSVGNLWFYLRSEFYYIYSVLFIGLNHHPLQE